MATQSYKVTVELPNGVSQNHFQTYIESALLSFAWVLKMEDQMRGFKGPVAVERIDKTPPAKRNKWLKYLLRSK